jgi:hypothetical protein
MSTASIPGSSGPVVLLEGHNGRFTGYNLRETAGSQAVVQFASGPTGAGTVLAIVDLAANGFIDFCVSEVFDGEQYVNGVYCSLLTGTMPSGFVRFRGPH